MEILALAEENQRKARQLVVDSGIVELWQAAGVEVRPVGSLPTGLLMKHRDIDFHLYSDRPDPAADFSVMAGLAADRATERIEFANLLATPEECLEWHVWYRAPDHELWQFDLIHIRRGSRYDGHFETVAARISEQLTPELRLTILTLKNETPDTEKIMGIEYYQAVFQDGIRNYAAFQEWRRQHPVTGIVEWLP